MKKLNQRFFKRVAACVVSAALVFAFTACGGGESNQDQGNQAAPETGEPGQAEKGYSVALVMSSPMDDKAFNRAQHDSLKAAADACGFEFVYVENVIHSDFVSTISDYASLGHDVVVAAGTQFEDAVKEAAANYPDVIFADMNSSITGENIVGLLPNSLEMGWAAGAVAALQTKTNQIGLVGVVETGTWVETVAGFKDAVRMINPDAEISEAYTGVDHIDEATGKEIAESLVSTKDVDIVFSYASIVDLGLREGLLNHVERYYIGNTIDVLPDYPNTILTTVCFDNQGMYEQLLNAARDGAAKNLFIEGTFANGGLYLGEINKAVTDEARAGIDGYIGQIKAGTFAP
ncbi:MAG: BMP family ABC transporter substrate-binding protein [Clostridiales bacterium]|nr:BMP family ABC transporter substrate-binding protein [Clostridiales bacterium]